MEFLFSLFFLSGFLKSFILFFEIPTFIDFTLLTILLLVFYSLIRFKQVSFNISKKQVIAFMLLSIFYCWLIFSLEYTISPGYSKEKTLYFSINMIGFLFPLIVRSFNLKKFIKYCTLTTYILTMIYLGLFYYYITGFYSKESFELLKGFYLMNGLFLGALITILFTSKAVIFKNKKQDYIFAFVGFLLLILLGARGPIIILVLILISFSLVTFSTKFYQKRIPVSLSMRRGQWIFSFFLLFSTIAILFVYSPQFSELTKRTFSRLSLITQGISVSGSNELDMGSSINTRVEQINLSRNTIVKSTKNFLIGEGIGSFGMLETGKDKKSYPHNIILEIWVELGLVGILLFSLFLIPLVSDVQPKTYISLFLIAYLFLNALKSNSFVDLRILFISLSLFMISSNELKPKKQ